MSLGRRLGRLARGFVSGIGEERLKETVRTGRERGETLKDALYAARRGFAEEWRAAEERTAEEQAAEEQATEEQAAEERAANEGRTRRGWRSPPSRYVPRKYPPEVISAYHRLGLGVGADMDEINRKRRELVKRYHPDRFADPEKRGRAERLTAEINAAHDTIERHLLRS